MARLLGLGLTTAVVACASFDEYAGGGDAGEDAKKKADATMEAAPVHPAKDADAMGRMGCTKGWAGGEGDAGCASRTLAPIVTGVGAVSILRVTRAFGGDVALLYDASTSTGKTLTLAIVDPVAGVVLHAIPIASATAFDTAALAYDDQGTVSVAYHAKPGTPVEYVAVDGGLEPSAPESVAADAGSSLVAVSAIPQATMDGGPVGPLGLVSGSVGIVWFAAPPEPNDFSLSYVHMFARQGSTWNEVETYGYTEIRSDLGLEPSWQRGVVASGITYSTMTLEPNEECTWQMAGRVSACGTANHEYGISLASGPDAAYLVYTFPDPSTGATVLDVAIDTDGSYTFPLLDTLTTLDSAAHGGVAEPRAALSGSTLVTAVIYPTPNLTFRVDLVMSDTVIPAVTTEEITTVTSTSASTPPLDLVMDGRGVATIAIANPTAGSVLLAQAVLGSEGDPGAGD